MKTPPRERSERCGVFMLCGGVAKRPMYDAPKRWDDIYFLLQLYSEISRNNAKQPSATPELLRTGVSGVSGGKTAFCNI